jgi:hypothetical protein
VGALLLALVAFDSVNQLLPTLEVRFADCIVLRMVQGICCIFLLCCEYEIFYNKALKASVVTLGRARADEAKSYAISQANANAINVKMHDLRHRLRDLDALGYVGPDELENLIESLNVYDASFKTGNDALDTVLTEKGLICEQSDIALGCIANGSVLSFMAPADIYAFFSSAIDNAIEAVQKFRATEHRIIDVTVKRSGDMAVIHVENYYKTDPNPESRAGRQRESIGRGYGMRHMRAVIERYGGALTTSVDGGLFRLDAIIPLPEGFDPNGTKETRHAAPRGSMP